MDRYELAAQGADNGLWDWDLTTNRVYYSPGWLAMLGCTESGCDNTPEEWFKRIHRDDLEAVRREITAHLEKGSTQFEIQHRMVHRDRSCRWMSCKGVISRDDAGKAVRIAGCHMDVTANMVVDPLTSLPNRLLLLDHLSRCIEKAGKQEDFLYAVLIVDLNLSELSIDHPETFKGGPVIIAAARRLETALRSRDRFSRMRRSDLVARSEGEEFIILLEGLRELAEAQKVAQRLLGVMLTPFALNGREISLRVSIGVALSATGYRDAEEALRDADTALYRAKSLGMSRYEIFDTAILESTQTQNQLEMDLHAALTRREFEVYYQPIVSLSANRIAGFEALIRWKHPSKGLVHPLEFIAVAEKAGLIESLDRWVLREACRQLKVWRENQCLPKDLWISVNLSAAELKRTSLAKEIRELLLEYDLDAAGLMLELTEGAVIENAEATQSLLMQLRVMGAKIGLDDFGTGYSSLSYLRQFPLDYLKIDSSFVRGLENRRDAQEIIRTIKDLADQLGLRVIAEGIENSHQLELICSLGCNYGQGFLFSKAVGHQQAESLLMDGLVFPEPASSHSKSAVEMDSLHDASSVFPITGPSEGSTKKKGFTPSRKYVFTGLTAVILLFLGGLLAKLNNLTSPPVAYTSPPASYTSPPVVPIQAPVTPAISEEPEKAVEKHAVDKAPAVQKKQKAPAVAKKSAVINPPPAVYNYQVEHDHRLGSCKGTLTITRDTISFASATAKDSFELKASDCLLSLDGDQLIIKAGSKTFKFKPFTSTIKPENQSHLSAILHDFSSFR